MDKDRIEGAATQAKGSVKEAAGKLTGDQKLQAEGKADKAAGKVQNAVGGIKDADLVSGGNRSHIRHRSNQMRGERILLLAGTAVQIGCEKSGDEPQQ